MDQEKDAEEYHDSEAEDIYDLYNACNGVMRNDLLDLDQLEGLSAEELAVLDVARLREIWHHMAAGCDECEAIVQTLNFARGRLRKSVEESLDVVVTI